MDQRTDTEHRLDAAPGHDINPAIGEKYGLEMTTFIVENVSVPPEVEQAIDKGARMAAIGNLNDYVKYQMAQGFEKGTPGTVGIGAELAVGMSVAQQIMKQPGGPGGLGGVEADVIASLEKGDLKGKS